MLNKKHRFPLRQSADFFKTSQRFFCPELTFFYRYNPQATTNSHPLQIAIIIPKKHFRLSTKRHYLKRRLALQFQPYLSRSELNDWEVVVSVTPKLERLSLPKIQTLLEKFFRELPSK